MSSQSIAGVVARPLAADAGRRFDWLVIAAIAWLLGGLFADGWAHSNRLPDSFWTVWHGIFYSGFAACAAVLAGAIALRRGTAPSWRAAVPRGYTASLAGVVVFAIGGLADAAWHTAFGVEVGNDILLSPSHMLLGLGMFLIVSGPFAAELRRDDASPALRRRLPMVLSLVAVFSLLTFFTLYSGPYSNFLGASGNGTTSDRVFRGLLGMFLFSGLISGLLLMTLRRTTLPVGSITVILGLDGVAMILMGSRDTPLDAQLSFIAVAITAGIVGDVLLSWMRPSAARPLAMRTIAAAVPMAYFVLYFAVVFVRYGFGWTFTFVAGSVILCGVVGLLLSFIAIPPAAGPA
ncbi:MAG TPA: hypothetical protein VIN70_04585 [Candidatus Limnocylindria bacterium]